MKKLLSFLLIMAMAISLFAACGKKSETKDEAKDTASNVVEKKDTQNQNDTAQKTDEKEEPIKISIYYSDMQHFRSEMTGLL